MPAEKQITKTDILNAAADILREKGFSAVNARSVAKRLGCSTQPIYLSFSGMAELKDRLILKANDIYQQYLADELKRAEYPPYKCYGMGYIRFAKEEKELFKLLFMRDRTKEQRKSPEQEKEELAPMLEINSSGLGISEDEAYLFHIEIWIAVHGIATMLATDYLDLDFQAISALITDIYTGLKLKYTKNKGEN